ncbi:MAG: methylated-DNA--[protein]-cysteine S-methyltransferase [Caldiserica bacterium]|nr:methylated-DNA--[protein]-cysteine S-methyltransferase [Caldisericota bacterium]
MDRTQELICTKFFTLQLVTAGDKIVQLSIIDDQPERIITKIGKLLKTHLEEFFCLKRKEFEGFNICPQGTQFQKDIWKVASEIPYGKTLSYGQTAALAGYPGANRACGQAMKNNPILILIPCHRVTGASSLGGYGGRPDIKKMLLTLENPEISSNLLRTS